MTRRTPLVVLAGVAALVAGRLQQRLQGRRDHHDCTRAVDVEHHVDVDVDADIGGRHDQARPT